MDATQTASKESSIVKASPSQEKSLESAKVEALPSPPDQSEIRPEISYAIPGELLRVLVDQKKKPSWWSTFLSHPLTVAVISTGLLGLFGLLLTYFLTNQQKEIEYQRTIQLQELTRNQSRLEEEHKVRAEKFREVWERLDADEYTIDKIIQEATFETENQSPELKRKRFLDITNLLQEDQAFVVRYRYWLGEDLFKATNDYLNLNIRLVRNQFVLAPETDLTELIKKRKEAKQDILEIRRLLDQNQNTQSTATPGK